MYGELPSRAGGGLQRQPHGRSACVARRPAPTFRAGCGPSCCAVCRASPGLGSVRSTSCSPSCARIRTRRADGGLTGLAAAAVLVVVVGALAVRRAPPAASSVSWRRAEARRRVDGDRRHAVHAAFVATGMAGAEEAYARTAAASMITVALWVACTSTRARRRRFAASSRPRCSTCASSASATISKSSAPRSNVLAHADAAAVSKSAQACALCRGSPPCADAAACAPPSVPVRRADAGACGVTRTTLARGKGQQRAGRYASALEIAGGLVQRRGAPGLPAREAEALYLLADVQDDRASTPTSERTFPTARSSRRWRVATRRRRSGRSRRSSSSRAPAGRFSRGTRLGEPRAPAESERLKDPFAQGSSQATRATAGCAGQAGRRAPGHRALPVPSGSPPWQGRLCHRGCDPPIWVTCSFSRAISSGQRGVHAFAGVIESDLGA